MNIFLILLAACLLLNEHSAFPINNEASDHTSDLQPLDSSALEPASPDKDDTLSYSIVPMTSRIQSSNRKRQGPKNKPNRTTNEKEEGEDSDEEMVDLRRGRHVSN
jgi:hypothetical protein